MSNEKQNYGIRKPQGDNRDIFYFPMYIFYHKIETFTRNIS